MSMVLFDLMVIALSAGAGAAIVFGLFSRSRKNPVPIQPMNQQNATGPVFLFENGVLVDATPDALSMIAPHTTHLSDYDAVLHVLGPHFCDLREKLAGHTQGRVRIDGDRDDALWIELDLFDDQIRIAVKGGNHATHTGVSDVIERDVRLSELSMLREMTQHTPQLIWQEDQTGKLVWANHAYLSFSDSLRAPDADAQPALPSQSVFAELRDTVVNKGTAIRRVSVPLPDKSAEQWFDVTSVPRENGLLHFATDANAVVRADQERRNFVQTLSKTFAQLSIGLAIFDKRRQLAMFNPALLDMTQLPVTFLSGRPTVDAVLDKLRESRMLPEPKDYTTWRDQFTALEVAAKNGTYCETWNLPDGQTYRVTGRPHPDGAFAFLFEDISAEVSLTRRFRSDIETGQAVLDTLPEAIAVFSSAGTLVMSNRAYNDLWSTTDEISIEQRELRAEMGIWRDRCTPTRMWTEMRDFIHLLGARKPWSDDAILDDGRHLRCYANPISGGMTMVRFTFAPPMKPIIRKLTMPDPAIQVAKR